MLPPEQVNELQKHAAGIANQTDLLRAPMHQQPRIMGELARTALGFDPQIDICDIVALGDKEALLVIMGGVRDSLTERRELRAAQVANTTQNVKPAKRPYFGQ